MFKSRAEVDILGTKPHLPHRPRRIDVELYRIDCSNLYVLAYVAASANGNVERKPKTFASLYFEVVVRTRMLA